MSLLSWKDLLCLGLSYGETGNVEEGEARRFDSVGGMGPVTADMMLVFI